MTKNDNSYQETYATAIAHQFIVSGANVTLQYFDFLAQAIDYGLTNGAEPTLLSALLIAKAENL